MRTKPLWDVEGRDWPNRPASRFLDASGCRWHVQVMGSGPVLLLIHGTGAATHSWRALAPMLGDRFTVVAPDLPGHGFTDMTSSWQMSLPRITRALASLLSALDMRPVAVVGHSAGAAIAVRLTLDRHIAPGALVSLNGALAPFPGLGAVLFPALAKLLFFNPLAARIVARRADDPAAVVRLIEGTGSRLDPVGLDLYRRLLRTERHVAAAMAMMANWDLRPLQRDLPRLSIPLTLVAADRDRAVPPSVATETMARVATARFAAVAGRGHLAHEEAPETVAEIIREACT